MLAPFLAQWPPRAQIILVVLAEHVQLDIVNADNALRMFFGQAGVADAHTVDDIYRAKADHPEELLASNQNGSIFVDAQPNVAWILCDRAEQPAHAPALGEVRVDHDTLHERQ